MLKSSSDKLKSELPFIGKIIYKFRYNGLALLNVLLQVLNSILNLNVFGVSAMSDAIFMSSLVVTSLSFISLFWMEQFWVFYAEIRASDREDAIRFYRVVVTCSIILQIGFVAVCIWGIDVVCGIFAGAIDPARLAILRPVLLIQLIGLLFFPLSQINGTILNAEKKISLGYIVQLLPLIFSTVILLFFLFFKKQNPEVFVFVSVLGTLLMVLWQFRLMKSIGIRYRPALRHGKYGVFLKSSFLLRIGQNINNFLQQPIISGALSGISAGAVSVYTYSRRFAEILYSITIGPEFLVLRQLINDKLPRGEVNTIKSGMLRFYKNAALMIPIAAVAWIFLVPLLSLVTGGRLRASVLLEIRNVFGVFVGWILLLAVEQPFVIVLLAAKRNLVFIIENLIYIGILFAAIALLLPPLGVLAFPVSLIMAQACNNAINISYGLRTLFLLKGKTNESPV